MNELCRVLVTVLFGSLHINKPKSVAEQLAQVPDACRWDEGSNDQVHLEEVGLWMESLKAVLRPLACFTYLE